jgi:hypothetical protein
LRLAEELVRSFVRLLRASPPDCVIIYNHLRRRGAAQGRQWPIVHQIGRRRTIRARTLVNRWFNLLCNNGPPHITHYSRSVWHRVVQRRQPGQRGGAHASAHFFRSRASSRVAHIILHSTGERTYYARLGLEFGPEQHCKCQD